VHKGSRRDGSYPEGEGRVRAIAVRPKLRRLI
jgi:hypothetical protein